MKVRIIIYKNVKGQRKQKIGYYDNAISISETVATAHATANTSKPSTTYSMELIV